MSAQLSTRPGGGGKTWPAPARGRSSGLESAIGRLIDSIDSSRRRPISPPSALRAWRPLSVRVVARERPPGLAPLVANSSRPY